MRATFGRRNGLQQLGRQAVRWAVRVPIFYKIIVANSLLVLLVTVLGWWLANENIRACTGFTLHWGNLLWYSAAALGAVILLNYAFRVALQPLRVLRQGAQALRRGDVNFQITPPRFPDPDVERVIEAINSVLKELAEYRQRLRDLSSRVSQQLEAERQNLARELHDDIAQNLTTLLVLEQLMSKNVTAEGEQRTIEQARELTRLTLDSVRRLSTGLRPAILDQLGLSEALRWYVEEVVADVLPEVTLLVSDSVGRLLPAMELALFRIAQEALSNVVHHAQAHHVTLGLHREPGLVTLQVADDGLGFNVEDLPKGGREHLGLFTMGERARLLGGSVEVTSKPGAGTTVLARLPLTPTPGASEHIGGA